MKVLKAFVYRKGSNEKVEEIHDVTRVEMDSDSDYIRFFTAAGDILGYDTSIYKTTTYQD